MALEKPIVQFDLTEGRYSAQDASLYADDNDPQDMANKILDLADNPERREEMGKSGRNRLEEKLSWQNQKKELKKLYDELFNNQNPN